MNPRVSVIMPVFNGERFIAEAVQSVLSNSFTDLELLLIDDGSTDRSLEVAQSASKNDSRLRIVRAEHGGVGAARNRGLAEARGEFIANLDSDDAMFANRLARQVAFLDANPAYLAVGSRTIVVDAKGQPQRVGIQEFTHEEIDRAHIEGRAGAILNPTAMFRRQAVVDVGGYRSDLNATGEDFDLWLRLAEVGRLANLRDVLMRYRMHDANVSRIDKDQRIAIRLETLRRAFARRGITDRTPQILERVRLSAGERWRNAALLAYYSGQRRAALVRALGAAAHLPSIGETGRVISLIVGTAPPRW
ncbi:MAG: glycosyltransferase family A protein [Gemmatimonadaceae bacterium]